MTPAPAPASDVSSDIGFYLDFLKSPFRMVSDVYNAQTTITALITLLLVVAVLVAFFFLIYGGIKWITSGGDKEAAATAQKTITAAIIGLALAFSAWAILSFTKDFFGIKEVVVKDSISNLCLLTNQLLLN